MNTLALSLSLCSASFIFGAMFDSNEECCAKWQRRDTLQKRRFSSPLEQRSIYINISPESSALNPGRLCVSIHSPAIIKASMSLSPTALECMLTSWWKMVPAFVFLPEASSLDLLVPAGSKLLKHPEVSDPLHFRWQPISIKRAFDSWVKSVFSSRGLKLRTGQMQTPGSERKESSDR